MLSDFLALIAAFVRDESGRIGDADRDRAFAAALARYDRDRPRYVAGQAVPHVVSGSEDSVPAEHREAVAAYAAALLLEQLAAGAINDGDSTIAADATARRSKADEYRVSARGCRARYADALAGPAAGGAAGAVVSWGGRSRLRPGWGRP